MTIEERSGVHVLQPQGDLTIFEASEFREGLMTLLGKDGPLELDLSQVERVDSSGIQLVVAGCQSGRLVVTGMASTLQERVSLIGCTELVKLGEA